MIVELIRWLDVLALWTICWCAFSALVGGHEVRDWKALAVCFALIGTLMFSFSGAVAVSVDRFQPAWWVSGLIISVALLAARWYDQRFGIHQQCYLFLRGAHRRWRALRYWWPEVRS